MFGTGWGEWLLVGAVVLLLFGAKRLPELAESFGKSIKSFKKGMKEAEEEPSSKKGPDAQDPPKSA
ncbi:MAG: twin-arginine translocase TatA/TatE family subunit [Elusimicrobia bacterium]|nr:twin-arginine translocase TatA/TatE family subunit [Elusimicrobiota bacterium]